MATKFWNVEAGSKENTQSIYQRITHLPETGRARPLINPSIRESYWVPKLRQLVKRIRSNCWGCERFRARSYENPLPGHLPASRTQGTTPFEAVGVDFAGPNHYKTKGKKTKKSYLVRYGCSLTRAVHLEVVKSLEVREFLTSLKRFIARRRRPKIICSYNGATFKAADKWLKKIQNDEQLTDFLSERLIQWMFNLSRAPWWGGQYERLIGLFKRAFYKCIGNGLVTYKELENVSCARRRSGAQ